MKRKLLSIVGIIGVLILNFTKTYALVARKVYNDINFAISFIMKLAIIISIIVYIIWAIIYFMKSKKEKNIKIKTLFIWLILVVVVDITLYFGSDIVLEAGATYTSNPRNIIIK